MTNFYAGSVVDYAFAIEIRGANIDGGMIETPNGEILDIEDGSTDLASMDLETFDALSPSGSYTFSIDGSSGDQLTFSLDVTRPSTPTGTVDIDSPPDLANTSSQPLLQWFCSGCLGDRLELFVVENATAEDVFAGPLTNTPGSGDARSGSATPDPLNEGLHGFETHLSNRDETAAQSVDPLESPPFDIQLLEARFHANRVVFNVGSAGIPAGEPVPIGQTFPIALGDGAVTAQGWPHVSSDPLTGRSLIVFNTGILDRDPFDFLDAIQGRVIDNDGVIGANFRIDVTIPSAGFSKFEPPSASWNSTLAEWLVVWSDNFVVYGQRVDADASLIGQNFIIAASKAGTNADANNEFRDIEQVRAEWSPSDGVYLVSWKARGTDDGVDFVQTVLATVIDEEGTWVLDGIAVDVSDEEANNGVSVAYSSTSDVWVVGWERQSIDRLPGARVLSVDPAGDLFNIVFDTTPLAVSTTGSGRGGAPGLAWDSTRDRFLILWRADQAGGEARQHWFNFIEPNGSFGEGSEILLSDISEPPTRARAAYSPEADEYTVVSASKVDGGEIFSWTISGSGASSSETTTLESGAGTLARPLVSYGNGRFRYAWWTIGFFWNDGLTSHDSVFAYVPEPSTLALRTAALVSLFLLARRRG